MKLIFILTSLIALTNGEPKYGPISTCVLQSNCLYVIYTADDDSDNIADEICLQAEFTNEINEDTCLKGHNGPSDCISWACIAGGDEDDDLCHEDPAPRCFPIDCDNDDKTVEFYLKDGSDQQKPDGGCGDHSNPFALPLVIQHPSNPDAISSVNAFCQNADIEHCDDAQNCNAVPPPGPINQPCSCKGNCDHACVWIIDYSDLCAPCVPCTSTFTIGGGISSLSVGDPFSSPLTPQTGQARDNNGEISHNNAFDTNNKSGGGIGGSISVNHLVIIIFCIVIVSAVIAGFVYYYVRVVKNRKFMKKVMGNVIINDEAEVAEQQNQMHMECESITNTPTSQNDNTPTNHTNS